MRWIAICLLAAAGFWYFSEKPQPDDAPGTMDSIMQECMAKMRYAASRMGTSENGAQQECADEHQLYYEDGHWYRY